MNTLQRSHVGCHQTQHSWGYSERVSLRWCARRVYGCDKITGVNSIQTIGVSGARGVIGRHLPPLIRRVMPGCQVTSYDGDIRDFDSARAWAKEVKPNLVFHLAAVVPTSVAAGDKERARGVNELGPAGFARAVMAGAGGRPLRFAYTSTSHVYSSSAKPIAEQGRIDPQNFYAETKLGGEAQLKELGGENSLFDLLILRLFSVYSEHQAPNFLFPSLREKIRRTPEAQGINLLGWNNIRDFLHAQQAADLVLQLGMTATCGVVNVGSGTPRTIKAFAEYIFEVGLEIPEENADPHPTSLVADIGLLRAILGSERVSSVISDPPRIGSLS